MTDIEPSNAAMRAAVDLEIQMACQTITTRGLALHLDKIAASLDRSPLSGTVGREEVDVPRFMEVVRSRWNYEPDQFNVIEQVLSDPECVAVLSLSHEAPAQEPVAWICWYQGNCDATVLKSRMEDWVRLGRKVEPAYAAPASHATRKALEWIVEKDVYWTSRGDYSGSEIIKTSTSGNVLVRGAYGTKAIRALASREDRAQAGSEQGHQAAELRAALDNYMEALSIENDGYADYTREATFKLEQLLWANKGTLIAAIAPLPADDGEKS